MCTSIVRFISLVLVVSINLRVIVARPQNHDHHFLHHDLTIPTSSAQPVRLTPVSNKPIAIPVPSKSSRISRRHKPDPVKALAPRYTVSLPPANVPSDDVPPTNTTAPAPIYTSNITPYDGSASNIDTVINSPLGLAFSECILDYVILLQVDSNIANSSSPVLNPNPASQGLSIKGIRSKSFRNMLARVRTCSGPQVIKAVVFYPSHPSTAESQQKMDEILSPLPQLFPSATAAYSLGLYRYSTINTDGSPSLHTFVMESNGDLKVSIGA